MAELELFFSDMPGVGAGCGEELIRRFGEVAEEAGAGSWTPVWVLAGMTAAAETLRERVAGQVVLARDHGVSWEDIGKALGVSRQAVQKKYGPACR